MSSDINMRWGRELTSEEIWTQMINRILNIFEVVGWEVEEAEAVNIAMRLGRRINNIGTYDNYNHTYYLTLANEIEDCQSPFELAKLIEALMNAVDKYSGDIVSKQMLMIFERAKTPIRLVKIEKRWVTYPGGEKLLDKNVIEKSLTFLEGKPLNEFDLALTRYAEGQWVESAEKSRRALEEYLRKVLGRPKIGLEAAIKEIGLKLKEQKMDEHLRVFIVNQLRSLDTYFNDGSKHASNSKQYDAEYVLYQAASLMKLLSNLYKASE